MSGLAYSNPWLPSVTSLLYWGQRIWCFLNSLHRIVMSMFAVRRITFQVLFVTFASASCLVPSDGAEFDVAAAETIDFARDIRPLLSNTCFKCHGPDEASREAELRLDTAEGAYADRGGYQAVKPHDVAASEFVRRMTTTNPDERMPPPDSGLELTPPQIDLLTTWIERGAVYDQHWAFRPIARVAVPNFSSNWGTSPLDRFIERRLIEAKLAPSPEAARPTLIRRVYLDLVGLPPTPAEVEQFLGDDLPGAYERMVERALTNPHYGERWGRHWLDQARFADTNGYSIDSERSMWPYRDWVIQSINADVPFDQFTVEQLAGDLLPSPTQSQLVATGFHRNTLVNQEGGTDAEQFRNEVAVDRVNTTGAVWLGLTVGCAQCHTHKYDPLTHHEYYQLFAFFNSSQDVNSVAPTLSLPTPEQQARLAEFDQQIAAVKTAQAQQSGAAELDAQLKELQDARKKFAAVIPDTMVMRELKAPRTTHVLIRGDFLRQGDVVPAAGPAFLPAMPESTALRSRLDLAQWLVSSEHPLTARVTVNRVWGRLFGEGLVETENDFGLQGTPPTHPELLDWLATELIDSGWSMKYLHRRIVTSATYRQSSTQRPEVLRVDPLNKLLARQRRLRVDAEIVRDLALATSGLLVDRVGGRSVHPPQPDGVYAFTQRNAAWPTSQGADRYRRGLYTFFMRSAPYPMLTTFDTPRFDTVCTQRIRSNTPLQSLAMANDEAMFENARALAQRLVQLDGDDRQRLESAYRLCFARLLRSEELAQLLDFLADQRADFLQSPTDSQSVSGMTGDDSAAIAEHAAWTVVARVLLNLDEFITRE